MKQILWRKCPGKAISGARKLMFGLSIYFLALSFFAQTTPSGTNNVKSPVSNRWLLVVETSTAMQSRSDTVHRIAATLLASGMNGQMQPGDTLGVWTYNRDLYAGQFPLQVWTQSASRQVASRAYQFLSNQKYGNEGHLEKVLPTIQRVVSNSEFITVILISTGNQKIQGTPYDERINSYYTTWQNQQQKAAIPFVTVLRAVRGQFKSYAVNTPPWPLEMPAVSPELVAARTPPKSAEPPKPAAPVYAAPLIISGHKPERETQSDSTTTATNDSAVQSAISPSASPTTATQPAEAPSGNPAPAIPEALVVTKGTQSLSPPSSVITNTSEPRQTIAAVEKPASSAATGQTPTAPAKAESTKSTSAVSSTKAIVPPVGSKPMASVPADSEPSSKPDPEAQTAVAAPTGNFLASRTAWIAGAVLLALGFALVLFLARHSRSSSHASLITRSLDRERK